MHDSMMNQIGMEHEHQDYDRNMSNDGWGNMNNYSSSQQQQQQQQQQQHQSPILNGYDGYAYIQPLSQSMPVEPPPFSRMPPPSNMNSGHQHLVPAIMTSHSTWPSMLTNPAGYQAPPVIMPQIGSHMKPGKLPSLHTSSPRKTLTDADRRRMCQFHEDNPTVKQTEIGAKFGVERSTVSKVLRQKDKYLFPEDRSLSPVKRSKGKSPDIDRALAIWARNSAKQGIPLSDETIKKKAQVFARAANNNESQVKANSTSWLEKFKQKNGIGAGKLLRRASETNVSDSGSLYPESSGPSAAQTPSGISPISPTSDLASPVSLSASKSLENIRSENIESFLDFSEGHSYRHANSQSTTSLSSAFTDSAPSPFSGDPTSPGPFNFSPETTCAPFLPSQLSRHSTPNIFQRPRSQTFPCIDPSYISPSQTEIEPLTPKYHQPLTAPSSALDGSHQDNSFSIDSAISSPPLRHHSSTGSMAHHSGTPNLSHSVTSVNTGSNSNTISNNNSPPSMSTPSSPSQEDAQRALHTLLSFFGNAPQGFVDEDAYLTVIKLTEKLRLQQNSQSQMSGGLARIQEQDNELMLKMESEMGVEC